MKKNKAREANAAVPVNARSGIQGQSIRHSDQLLRKHQLCLKQAGHKWQLIDWLDENEAPVNKQRASAYLNDLKSEPGFPGPEIAAQLREFVDSVGENEEIAKRDAGGMVQWVSGFLTGTVRSPRNYSRSQLLDKIAEVLNVIGWAEGCEKEIPHDKYPQSRKRKRGEAGVA